MNELESQNLEFYSKFIHILELTTGYTMESVSDEVTNPFAFAEEIFSYSDRLWRTLAYFSALSVFLVVLVIWLALGQPSIGGWELLVFGVAFLLALYFPFAVWNSFRLILPLRRWIDDYFDFAFIVKFELLPANGANPTDRILNKLGEVYPEVARLVKKDSKAIRRSSGIAKKSKVIWDAAVDLKYPRVIRVSWIHRHIGEPEYLLVKRFGGESSVSASDLRSLAAELRLDLRWQNGSVRDIFVLSPRGFEEDAIASAKDESVDDWFRSHVELIVETFGGYELAVKD